MQWLLKFSGLQKYLFNIMAVLIIISQYYYCENKLNKLKYEIEKLKSEQINSIFDLNTKCLLEQMKQRINNAKVDVNYSTNSISF